MNESEQNIKGGSLIVSTVPVAFMVPGACRPLTSRSPDGEPVRIWLYRWAWPPSSLRYSGRHRQIDFPQCSFAAGLPQPHSCTDWDKQIHFMQPLYSGESFCARRLPPARVCQYIYTLYIYILCICMHSLFFFFLPPQVCLHFYGQICCWYLENDANEITRPLSPSSRGCPLRSCLWARGWCRQRRWSSPPKKLQKAASMNSSSSEAEASQKPPRSCRTAEQPCRKTTSALQKPGGLRRVWLGIPASPHTASCTRQNESKVSQSE